MKATEPQLLMLSKEELVAQIRVLREDKASLFGQCEQLKRVINDSSEQVRVLREDCEQLKQVVTGAIERVEGMTKEPI